MTVYFASVMLELDRWTPVNPGAGGFPTYRAAMEEIHAMAEEMGVTPDPDSIKILLDVTSVDLSSRDDFLAMMAYDPVLKTMFDFARFGGQGQTPDEAVRTAHLLEDPVPPPTDRLAAAANRLGALPGYVAPPDAIDHRVDTGAQERLAEVREITEGALRRDRLCTCGHRVALHAEEAGQRPCMFGVDVARSDVICPCDNLDVELTQAELDSMDFGDFDNYMRSRAKKITATEDGRMVALEGIVEGELVRVELTGEQADLVREGPPLRVSIGEERWWRRHPAGPVDSVACALADRLHLTAAGTRMTENDYQQLADVAIGCHREIEAAAVVLMPGSKDDAQPPDIAGAIATAGAKGRRLQALHDFKPLMDLAIDRLVVNAARNRGEKLHPDTVRQLAHEAYGQVRLMLQTLGVTEAELDEAGVTDA